MAKASNQNGFDGEGRKPGDRSGLDRPFEKRPGKTPKGGIASATPHGCKAMEISLMIDDKIHYE